MQMLYNSDSFAVVQIDVNEPASSPLSRGGFEIVDKFARKEIFIQGALAERFRSEVQALADSNPSEEEMDAYIGGFSALMQHPLVLH